MLTRNNKSFDIWNIKYLITFFFECRCHFLTGRIDPRGRTGSDHYFRTCCLSVSYFSKYRKTKQLSSENSDRFWRDRGSGRVDHWWHTCLVEDFGFREIRQVERVLSAHYSHAKRLLLHGKFFMRSSLL